MNSVSCITLQKRVITGGSEKVREAYLETAEQTQTFVEVFICKLPISQGFKGFRIIKNR